MKGKNYSFLREEAEKLYNQLGRPEMNDHFRTGRVKSIDEVAGENLQTLISDLKMVIGC